MPLDFRQPRPRHVPPDAISLMPRDMTAILGADVPLSIVQSRLAEVGQWLPIDGDPNSTIGHLIETNSTGPLRLGFGAWRDLLLGVQFKNGNGELITAGGQTMKNVAGYDLTKFMVGQRRIFGQIITATTRTYRRPSHALHIQLPPDLSAVHQLIPSPLRPQWMILTQDHLHCGYLGDQRTIGFLQSKLPMATPTTLDQDISLRSQLWSLPNPTLRAALPPSRLQDFATQAHLTTYSADPAFGLLLSWDELSSTPRSTGFQPVTNLAQSLGGTILLQNSTFKIQNSPDPHLLPLLTQLKKSFDPHNTLSPLP